MGDMIMGTIKVVFVITLLASGLGFLFWLADQDYPLE